MLRLAPPGYERFLQSPQFVATFGGGEANVAVALAAFGWPAAYVTALPPLSDGASHETVALPDATVADTPAGADGTVFDVDSAQRGVKAAQKQTAVCADPQDAESLPPSLKQVFGTRRHDAAMFPVAEENSLNVLQLRCYSGAFPISSITGR